MGRHFWSTALSCAVTAVLGSEFAEAHPGRTDSSGGHHDRKSGGYHYHGGASSSSSSARHTSESGSAASVRTTYRSAARTEYRAEPNYSYRTLAIRDYATPVIPKEEPRKPVATVVVHPQLEAHFRFHFTNGTTKDVASYDEFADRYMLHLTYGGSIGFPKDVVVRIEPLTPVATAS